MAARARDQRRRRLNVRLMLIGVLGFLGLSAPVLAQKAPRFEKTACPDDIQADRCGFVTVPENRQQPGREVRLFVVINEADGEKPEPDPVFVLSGGPGEQAKVYYEENWLFANRDVVYFDQRGNGYSQPALECPELQQVYDSGHVFSKRPDLAFAALGICGRRFRARGIDLSAYNTTESAQDIEAIRQALGYGKINLLGISYGTRLAQETMRAHSDRLRAVVMDSVLPASVNHPVDLPFAIEESLQAIFKACAAHPECAETYPHLESNYLEILSHLDAGAQPPDDDSWPMEAAEWQLSLVHELYNPRAFKRLPFWIDLLYSGDDAPRRRPPREIKLSEVIMSEMSLGTFIAVTCRGETAFTTAEAIEQSFAALPQWRDALGRMPEISSPRLHQLCQDWGLSEPSGRENEAVKSAVPTLLLAGFYDPVTPPRYLNHVADHLETVYPFVLTTGSHGVIYSHDCAGELAETFIADPQQPPAPECAEEDVEYRGRTPQPKPEAASSAER